MRLRLGPVAEPVTPLGGGLANLVLRVGEHRVLRIYQRDVAQLGLEASLLARPWRTFRVPEVLARGADFLVLEHVPHGPLPDSAASGAAVGAALAEIHGNEAPAHGHIDEALRAIEPWPDFTEALLGFARQTLADAEAAPSRAHRPALATLRAAGDALERRHGELEAMAGPPLLQHGDFKVSNLHLASDGALLVLDWEFAFAGPSLCDVGQLMRWRPCPAFEVAFAAAYRQGGGALPDGWQHAAALVDLGNLMALLARATGDPRRVADLRKRIRTMLAADRGAGR